MTSPICRLQKSDSIEEPEPEPVLTKAEKKKAKKGKRASPEDEEGEQDQGKDDMENESVLEIKLGFNRRIFPSRGSLKAIADRHCHTCIY